MKRVRVLLPSMTMVLVLAVACKSNDISSTTNNTTNNNTSVTQNIGPQGGEIDGPEGIKVKFPAGAVPATQAFTIGTTTQYPDLSGRTALGSVFTLQPHGFVFSGAVTVELPLDGAAAAQVLHSNCSTNGACQAWDTSVSNVSFTSADAVFPAASFSLYALVAGGMDAGSDASADDGSAGIDGAAADADAGGFPCTSASPLPGNATRSVSLALSGVDLGDASSSDWQTIGLDLDAKCTVSSSADVCTLYSGAPQDVQDDGVGGIDNSFGETLCPLLEDYGTDACSSALSQVFLTTDSTGSGSLHMTMFQGKINVAWPVQDVYVVMNGSGGMVGGVMPTSQVVPVIQTISGQVSASFCGGSAFASIANDVEESSDILPDGSNVAGSGCGAISFGLKFTGSSPIEGGLPATSPDVCAD